MKILISFIVITIIFFSFNIVFHASRKTSIKNNFGYQINKDTNYHKIQNQINKKNNKILAIDIRSGKYYEQSHKFGLIKLNVIPQIAIWLEEKNSKYIDTIFVTQRSGKSNWIGGKEIRRPEALPIWSHKRGKLYSDGLYMPDKNNPLPDAITGATPKKSFAQIWNISPNIPDGEYFLNVEVNSSFDYNDFYTEKLPINNQYYNNISGQPSVLWRGKIDIGIKENLSELKIVGHGNPAGINGDISSNLNNLSTALQIIDSIRAKFEVE